MSEKLPIITWDYDFSPFGQKIRTLLKAASVPFSVVDQPVTLPRPDLNELGITYRRIPVLAIGKDVYCDTSAIIDAIQRIHGGLPTNKADKAYELFGANVFNSCLPVIPNKLLSPEFVKDRETIFPILGNPRLDELRPNGYVELKTHMHEIEDFLGNDPFIGGQHISLADVHVGFSIRWLLNTLEIGKGSGYDKNAFPKLYNWLEKFPGLEMEKMDAKAASRSILEGAYTEEKLSFDGADPLNIPQGTEVQIESSDAALGAHPQLGRLEGLTKTEIVLQLSNGLRLHFPRTGYLVFKRK